MLIVLEGWSYYRISWQLVFQSMARSVGILHGSVVYPEPTASPPVPSFLNNLSLPCHIFCMASIRLVFARIVTSTHTNPFLSGLLYLLTLKEKRHHGVFCLLSIVQSTSADRKGKTWLYYSSITEPCTPCIFRLWFECLWITSESVFTLPAHVLSMELNKITIMSNCISKCLFLNRTQMASLECDTNIALSGWVVEVCGCVPVCARVC